MNLLVVKNERCVRKAPDCSYQSFLLILQGHCGVVELLVNHSADITAWDEDGDTPLHLALLKNSTTSLTHPTHAPNITKVSSLPLS